MTNNDKENIRSLVKETIILIILVVSIYYGFTYGLKIALNTDTPIMVVVSGSMRPTININDLIIVMGVNPKTLDVNDIIVFKHPNAIYSSCENGYCIVHRIVEVISRDPPMFKTKGDANPSADPFIVKGEQVVGKVIFVIPKLGILTRLFQPPLNYIIILVIILIYIAYEAKEVFKT